MTGAPVPRDLDGEARGLFERFDAAGQDHVFRFWSSLGATERDALLDDARSVDLELVDRLLGEVLSGEPRVPALAPVDHISPDAPDRAEAMEAGRQLFRDGRVAFYTVAGGQGTRLGFDGPKGCYPVGPFSRKTLFRWHAEKVLAASRRYGRAVPWVLLVSDNEDATRAFFEENAWFGLEGRVEFVRQRMLPAVDDDGKILLSTPSRIALSPNGHGGSIEALASGGALARLEARGIEIVSYFQVDNAPLNAADPAFLGYQKLRGAEMSVKVVMKKDPLEKAGVVALLDGKPGVIEYSELPEDLARQTDAGGDLVYGLANIAAHGLTVPFLERMSDRGLPFHTARKKIPTVDGEGKPASVMGRKFETFIFDAIPEAQDFVVFLTDRSEEFAPLKNAEGDNSPRTVRESLLARTRLWYERAGLDAPEAEEELEMSPLTAYDPETFEDWIAR